MKTGLIRLAVAGMIVAGACTAMAQEAVAPKHEASAKPHRTEWKGVLAAPAAGVAADVLAVLTVKRGEVSKTYNLTSTDAEVAAKIKDEAAKGATVVVKGELSKDETAIAVTRCNEPVKAGGHSEKPAASTVAPVAPVAPATTTR